MPVKSEIRMGTKTGQSDVQQLFEMLGQIVSRFTLCKRFNFNVFTEFSSAFTPPENAKHKQTKWINVAEKKNNDVFETDSKNKNESHRLTVELIFQFKIKMNLDSLNAANYKHL